VRDIREVPVFVTDRQRVLETLVAVTTNALEAMESTPINERFLAISLDQPSTDRARIEVRDFGVGIERHQLSRIFAAGITTKTGGSGFGLHLASLAAAELGGAISVASDGPGTGATFTLELPIADARAASAAEAA
jgi:signal transduction histidine kinase